jgi:hypothetical protein
VRALHAKETRDPAEREAELFGRVPESSARRWKRWPTQGRLSLVVAHAGETDVMTLKAECSSPGDNLQNEIVATLMCGHEAWRRG